MYFFVTSSKSERRLMAEVLAVRKTITVHLTGPAEAQARLNGARVIGLTLGELKPKDLVGDTRLAAAMADAMMRSRPNGQPRGEFAGSFIDGWNAAWRNRSTVAPKRKQG